MTEDIILQGSSRTAFLYRIDGGMDERDRDEIEAMDSGYVLGQNWPSIVSDSVDLHHRMKYIRQRNLGFSFLRVGDPEFNIFLENIHPALPRTLAYIVSDFYRDGTSRVSDLMENCERRNPAGLTNAIMNGTYRTMMGEFLENVSNGTAGLTGERLLDHTQLDRVPADRFGCASISGDIHSGFTTQLILQIRFV
ncbi:MAG: HpaII family restriction endonuclease [archaeon]|nr:HpaII family restriction endonuclease [archaeon]